jgi:hypothetical protein
MTLGTLLLRILSASLLLFALAAALFAVAVHRDEVAEAPLRRAELARMVPLTARVTEARFAGAEGRPSRGTWRFGYAYQAPDGKSYAGDVSLPTYDRHATARAVGDALEIYVDPQRPSIAHTKETQELLVKEAENGGWSSFCQVLLAIAGGLAIAGVVAFLLGSPGPRKVA